MFILLLGTEMVPLAVYANGQESLSEEQLTATVSEDDTTLEAEAAQLGIPASQTKRYVVNMRSLNRNYNAGAFTKAEYVGRKRELIERLK